METWKAIPGYEGLYEMNLEGKIRSLNYLGKKGNVQELKPGLNRRYLQFCLGKNGINKRFKLHVLLAMTFLEHIPNGNKLVVDHINNDPLDNRLDNLQIITNRKNLSKDKKRNLPTGVYILRNKFRAQIHINGKNKHIGCFSTPEEASEAYQNQLKKLC